VEAEAVARAAVEEVRGRGEGAGDKACQRRLYRHV